MMRKSHSRLVSVGAVMGMTLMVLPKVVGAASGPTAVHWNHPAYQARLLSTGQAHF